MSQTFVTEGEKRLGDAGSPPRAILKTMTPFQIYKSSGLLGSAAAFNVFPSDEALPYKIQSAELTLLAALDVVEANAEDKLTYGPATLHAASNYLTCVLSFISVSGRLHELPKIGINYDALKRLFSLYNASNEVKKIVENFALKNFPIAEVPRRDFSVVVDSINILEKTLRQEMRDTGVKIGVFTKSTVSLEKTTDAAKNDGVAFVSTRRASCKRSSSSSEKKEEDCVAESDNEPLTKVVKLEDGSKRKRLVKKPSPQPLKQTVLYGRLKTMTTQEKKVVSLLNQMTQLLGHVYAMRYNNLLPVFDLLETKVKQIQEIILAERDAFLRRPEEKSNQPEPFLDVELDGVLQAIHTASEIFRTDEECRYELDEDLLHPIAHACMTEVNRIEGFTTAPFVGPSAEALEAKAKAREAARERRNLQRLKALELAKAKEELAAKREEERQRIRIYMSGADPSKLVEDTSIKNPVKSAFVRYSKLPLETPEMYEQALFIWAMITSLPKCFVLSQMPFDMFLKALLMDDSRNNILMEEIVQALLNFAIEHGSSSLHDAQIMARGMSWFDSMVEFVAITSGNVKKKKKKASRRVTRVSYEDEDEEEDDDIESSGTSYEEDNESAEEEEENDEEDEKSTEAADNENVVETEKKDLDSVTEGDSFCASIKATMQRVAELRQMATWGNVTVNDRLNLLQHVLLNVLNMPAAQDEAEKVRKMHEETQLAMEKQTREICEEAEKEIKRLLKQFSTTNQQSKTTDTYETKRQQLIEDMERRLRLVVNEHVGLQDGKDIGALICPLGMDRYRRIFWRFPFDRHILVQTTAATESTFPVLSEPRELLREAVNKTSKSLFLDDEMEEEKKATRQKCHVGNGISHADDEVCAPQRIWGVVPPEYLNNFIEGLDKRGVREAALRRSLELLRPYLLDVKETPQGRITRTRSHSFGYFNKLKFEV